MPLLLIAGGAAAAYFLLKPSQASAATAPAKDPPQPAVPLPPEVPVFVLPAPAAEAPRSPPFVPAPAPARATAPAPPYAGETRTLELTGSWVWPVPRWQRRAPVASDKFGSPRPGMLHQGVDVMFGRIASDPYPPGSVNGSRHFVMPDAWPAVAASDGVLWEASKTARGYAVTIDHGPVKTFYQHLSALYVPETPRPRAGVERAPIRIRAGQPIGVIGGDPIEASHLKHLHFELWLGQGYHPIDPAPYMRTWRVLNPEDLAPFLTLRNAKQPTQDVQGRERERLAKEGLVYVVKHARKFPQRL